MSGAYIGIAKNIDDDIKDKSKQIVKRLLSDDIQLKSYEQYQIYPALNDVYNTSELSQSNAYLGGDNILSITARSSDLVETHTPSPVDSVASDAFSKAILAVKNGEEVSVALRNAQDSILSNSTYIAWKNAQ